MNELECIMDMFINDDYISDLINELDINLNDLKNNNSKGYCTSVITGKIAPRVRNYINSLSFNDFDYKEINKAIGNRLYKTVKNILYDEPINISNYQYKSIKLKQKNKLRVFEAFSGYGSQSLALRNIGIPYEVVAISEIDKYVIQAYKSIHGEVFNLGDISKINIKDIPKHDLFTYSFPCQDISLSGKINGIKRGKTRSGLLYECEKIIEHCKPKYLLLENVKSLVGKKFKSQFDDWLKYLEQLGYTNYWKVLDAKNYGIPQSRERVFVVSILEEHKPFEFPKPIPLDKSIKDILENNVDEKYYLSNEIIKKPILNNDYITGAIRGRYNEEGKIEQQLELRNDNITNTITTVQKDNVIITENYKLRKLTPRECFRLMGMNDNDIDKIQDAGISNTQQYKMAGNSIVIDVLEAIFKNLFL